MNKRILFFSFILTLLSLSFLSPLAFAHSHVVATKGQRPGKPPKLSSTSDPYQYCFNISTWVVPPETLLAYLYDNGTNVQAVDQTVWVISSYHNGYFFGQAYTSLDNSILSQRNMIGSVTSTGKVYITFYSGSSSSTDLVNGVGTLYAQSSGQCYFIMQMNSGQNGTSGLAHWSYMQPVVPGDPYYNSLPGVNVSVPDFLAEF